jgi:hypothetical protein
LPELLIATARRSNLLLRNRGGLRFEADTTTALQADRGYGYGLSWTDVNGDGHRDLFVANFDGPNFLYFGTDGVLEASSVGERLTSAASKGHTWGDFDLDGHEDLYLGSGTPAEGMQNRLYRGGAHAGFISVLTGDAVEHADTSAGIAWADYDLDGDLDLFVANWGSHSSLNRLYRNMGRGGNWLRVRLEGRQTNRMGIGARVSVLARIDGAERWLHRWLDASTGYAGQNEPVLHFGLDASTEVDSVRVTWPSGIVDRWGKTSARTTLHLVEGTGTETTPPAARQR